MATETFTGAAGAIGGSWVDRNATGDLHRDGSGNGRASATGVEVFSEYSGAATTTDHEASVIVNNKATVSGQYGGPAVRMTSGGAGMAAELLQGDTTVSLNLHAGGGYSSTIGSWTLSSAPATGETYTLRAVGTSYTFYKNGVQVGSAITDSSATTGTGVGIKIYSEGSKDGMVFSEWSGADVGGGGGGSAVAAALHHLRQQGIA